MSRSAIIEALYEDSGLTSLGVEQDSILQGQGLLERPTDRSPFILLNWQEQAQNPFGNVKAPRTLVVWVHYPSEVTNDYSKIDSILDRVENVLVGLEDVSGDDGHSVTCVRSTGRSSDLKDEGLQTFCRYAAFQVLSRKGVI